VIRSPNIHEIAAEKREKHLLRLKDRILWFSFAISHIDLHAEQRHRHDVNSWLHGGTVKIGRCRLSGHSDIPNAGAAILYLGTILESEAKAI